MYDRKAKARSYQSGDWILLVLLTQWQGPFKILGAIGAHTYKVLVKAKSKIFHANLLKTYVHREESVVVATVVYEDVNTPETTTNSLPSCPLGNTESYLDVAIGEELSPKQQTSMTSLLHQYQDIWTDVPGCTKLAEFKVNMTSDVLIQCDTKLVKLPLMMG